jgi:superfamily II DNA helicase RecQ
MYMLVILAILKDPDRFSTNSFPKNPCLVVICPTIPLQLEMVSKRAISLAELLYLQISEASKMSKVGLEVTAINSSTRDEALRHQQEELWVTVRTSGNVIVAGPEQLKSKEFEKSVLNDVFWAWTCGLGFDEVHLLNVWGPHFRKDFLQMGFVKAQLNNAHCPRPWILTSATVREGAPLDNIIHLLGLRRTPLHTIRRSNYRREIQLLFRELTSPIDGDSFPELEWVLESGCSTLIFAKTISLGTRIHSHLFKKAAPGNRDRNIRLYNSLN